jgi:cytochrome c
MKSIIISGVVFLGLMAASSVVVAETAMPTVGTRCTACHSVDTRVTGPAFKDVGEKYKADKDAINTITKHIMSGGRFGWNAGMKMPPRGGTDLTDAQIKEMATFISGLRK